MVFAVALAGCGRIDFHNAPAGDADLGDANLGDASSDAMGIAVPIVSDDFGRSVANDWGTADVGGDWYAYNPNSSGVNVSSGHGSVVLSSTTAYSDFHVMGVTARDTQTSTVVSFDRVPTSGTYTVTVSVRWLNNGSDYRLHLDVLAGGALDVFIERGISSTYVTLANGTPTVMATAGVGLALSLAATGVSPTTLCGKLWLASTAEPSACTITIQDSTPALQAPGISYLVAYDSGGTPPTVSFATFRFLRVGPQ
jgi:hypothetical protein